MIAKHNLGISNNTLSALILVIAMAAISTIGSGCASIPSRDISKPIVFPRSSQRPDVKISVSVQTIDAMGRPVFSSNHDELQNKCKLMFSNAGYSIVPEGRPVHFRAQILMREYLTPMWKSLPFALLTGFTMYLVPCWTTHQYGVGLEVHGPGGGTSQHVSAGNVTRMWWIVMLPMSAKYPAFDFSIDERVLDQVLGDVINDAILKGSLP